MRQLKNLVSGDKMKYLYKKNINQTELDRMKEF